MPVQIKSDRGKQFDCELFRNMCQLLDVFPLLSFAFPLCLVSALSAVLLQEKMSRTTRARAAKKAEAHWRDLGHLPSSP